MGTGWERALSTWRMTPLWGLLDSGEAALNNPGLIRFNRLDFGRLCAVD